MILTLERVGFDRMVERGRLRQGVFWAVMLFVLQLAFGVFGSNPISELLRGLIAYLPNVFVAILIVVGSVIVAVGGGGIRTMQRYWDRMAGKAEERGPELRQQAQASAAQAQAGQRYGDGRTAEYPSTQGASATDLYDAGSGQGSRTLRGR